MPGDSERKNKERIIVLVVISLNALVTVLLIAGMVHTLTRIKQQQNEITNLRKLLSKPEQIGPRSKEQKAAEEYDEEKSFDNEITTKSKVKKEFRKKVEVKKENLEVEKFVSRPEMSTKRNCCGVRGKRGRQGRKGDRGDQGDRGQKGVPGDQGNRGEKGDRGGQGDPGEKGDRGDQGDIGRDGRDGAIGLPGRDGIPGKDGKKGEKGNDGASGIKGSKGDRGPSAQIVLYSESAHLVGAGGSKKLAASDLRRVAFWSISHKSGNMDYKDGYLIVGVDGYYNIYSQMHYRDKTSIMGYHMFIDDRKVLKAVHSVVSDSRKYQTQYVSGVFKITKGQKISVGSPFTKYYYFEHSSSYFGAFMVHR